MQIVGPSLSGKTTFLYDLVKDAPCYFRGDDGSRYWFRKILYCYVSACQPIFNQFQEMGVQFHEGLPDNMEALCPPETRPGLIIMDDLMHESSNSSQVTNLLAKGTHHLDLFAISLLQNLFHSGREQAGQNRNYHYTILFKNPADTRYIKMLGNRWLGDSEAFLPIYKKATEKPYGYVLADHHPRTDDAIRFRTQPLINDPEPLTVLQPAQRKRNA